jgi:NAD(P)-dependent dehydrogenase (short-subunit alcohol dehydrogenase family)
MTIAKAPGREAGTDALGPALERGAVITGASSGIGAAIARRLARDGFDLVVCARDESRLEGLCRSIGEAGGRALALSLELGSIASIEAAFARIDEAECRADVLVNNAGGTLRRAALDVTPEEWSQVIDANLRGTFFMTQAFGRRLVSRGCGGCVINIGSTHGLVGFAGRSVYGISKAGITQLSRLLAIEWAEHGIRVNTVAPGTVETPSRTQALAEPELRDAMIARIPARRFATPEEVAGAVSYLASQEASYITGSTLLLDGGLTAA